MCILQTFIFKYYIKSYRNIKIFQSIHMELLSLIYNTILNLQRGQVELEISQGFRHYLWKICLQKSSYYSSFS